MTKIISPEKKGVLFFDDEPYISGKIAKSLELEGWDVTFIDNVNDLFMELRSRQFNIIILDIMAPVPEIENKYVNFTKKEIDEMDEGMNTGVVIAQKIWREIDSILPIIFLSARRPASITNLSKNYRFDYMRKPVLAETLDIKLKVMLNH